MANKTVNSKLTVYMSWIGKLFFVTGLIVISTATPLFSLVVGGLLFIIGDRYAGNINHQMPPTAYVILGGGLTKKIIDEQPIIALNAYSEHRTQTAWHIWQQSPLPIIISGVESPWIQDRLSDLAGPIPLTSVYTENASMNTCENAHFTAKLIDYEIKQGALSPTTHLYLVSDWYHMARARRQFAKVGFLTTPIIAPMPTERAWTDIPSNLNHSRRAFYESVALIRDMIRPQSNCRTASKIDINIIKTPRRKVETF